MVAARTPTDLIPRYAAALEEGGYSPLTARAYLADLGFFRAYVAGAHGGEPDWARLRPATAAFFLNRERARVSASTVQRRACAVRHFLGFLARAGVVPRSLVYAVPRTKGIARPPTRTLDDAELVRLLAVPGTDTPSGLRDAALLALLTRTGMRISEALALNLTDRVQGLDEETDAPLGRYRDEARPELARRHPDEPALFVNHRGERLTRQGFWLRMKAHAQNAGLADRVSPRTLRRTKAVALTAGGATAAEVGAALGCSAAAGYRARAVLFGGRV